MDFGQNDKNFWHNKEMVFTRMLHVRHFGVMDLMHSHNLLTLNIFLIKFSIKESINRLGFSLNKTVFSLADVEVKDT